MRTPRYNRVRECWCCGTIPDPAHVAETGGLRPWRGRLPLHERRAKADPWICDGCLLFAAKCLSGVPANEAAALLREAKRRG